MGQDGIISGDDARREYRWARLLWPLFLYKVYLLVLVYLVSQLLPSAFATEIYYDNFRWPPDAPPTWASAYKTWDGNHYLYLSEMGYQPGAISNAFYPLWPICIRLGSWLFLGNYFASALVLSNLFSLAGWLLFHRFVWDYHSEKVADLATLFLLAYPGALFFAFPYSESLFFLLCIAFFVALYRRHYLFASLASFFLPLTRVIGVFIGVPFFYDIYQSWKEAGKVQLGDLAYLIAPSLGMLMHFAIMYISTGNPLEGMNAQMHYVSQRSASKLLDIPAFVRSFFDVKLWHGFLDSPFDRLCFLIMLLFLVKMWKMDRRYALFAIFLGLVSGMAGTLMSFMRYLAIVFPLFIAVADVFSKEKWKKFQWLVLAVSFSLQIIFLIRHINNYWVG
jgi:hypothetical protein